MKVTGIALAVILVVIGIVGYSAMFTVHETEQALVLQFGDPRRSVSESGLHFKTPVIQNVVYLEKRILDLDAPKQEVIASDKKRIVVDAYARFRIKNALEFYRTVNNEAVARTRLANIINSSLREVLARFELQAVMSGERGALMREIANRVTGEASKFGVEIVDVRLKRADLPEENSQAVYRRMQAERERDARELRARGAEEAQKIRADADRQQTVLLAEAERLAQVLRGQGDADRTRILGEAYGRDSDFFDFYRTLEAYRTSLANGDTSLVLSPDSDFLKYFGSSMMRDVAPGMAPRGTGQ
jgi:membrane protease subunit HflC